MIKVIDVDKNVGIIDNIALSYSSSTTLLSTRL